MTTGTNQIGSNPHYGFLSGFGFIKNWTGGDGRYETVDGYLRSRWNPYSMDRASRIVSNGYYSGRYGVPQWISPPGAPIIWNPMSVGVVPGYGGNVLSFNDNDQLGLLNKLSSGVKDHSFNLAVNASQAKKMTNTAVDALGTLARSFLALRHGDVQTAVRRLATGKYKPQYRNLDSLAVASRWLELQYAWKPTVNDVYEACKAYEAISSGPRSMRTRVQMTRKLQVDGTPSPGVYSAMVNHRLTRSITYEATEEMSIPRQLGLLDPLTLAWELLPYSFVLDWFVPIGSYLEAMNAIPSLKGRFLQSTRYLKSGWRFNWAPENDPYTIYEFSSYPIQSGESLTVERSPGITPVVPTPTFNAKGLTVPRFWNALALARSAFGINKHGL